MRGKLFFLPCCYSHQPLFQCGEAKAQRLSNPQGAGKSGIWPISLTPESLLLTTALYNLLWVMSFCSGVGLATEELGHCSKTAGLIPPPHKHPCTFPLYDAFLSCAQGSPNQTLRSLNPYQTLRSYHTPLRLLSFSIQSIKIAPPLPHPSTPDESFDGPQALPMALGHLTCCLAPLICWQSIPLASCCFFTHEASL